MSNENLTETKPVEQTQATEQTTPQANENLLTTQTDNDETATTEAAETERPTWLPEKFKTAEEKELLTAILRAVLIETYRVMLL